MPAQRPPSPAGGGGRIRQKTTSKTSKATSSSSRTSSPRSGGVIIGNQSAAKARLDLDSIDILTRQKTSLEKECERLRREVDRASQSFKMAWLEERAAHQRDLEEAEKSRVLAEEAERKYRDELRSTRSALDDLRKTSTSEIEALRRDAQCTRTELESCKSNDAAWRRSSEEQIRSLETQLAKAHAERGALFRQFSAKLAALTGESSATNSKPLRLAHTDVRDLSVANGSTATTGGGGGSIGPERTVDAGTDIVDDFHATDTSGSDGAHALLGTIGDSYAGLSIFTDASSFSIAQLSAVLSSSPAGSARDNASAMGVASDSCISRELSSNTLERGVALRRAAHGGSGSSSGGGGAASSAGDAQQAIRTMRLEQQLRQAEAELERASRLVAGKTRRVSELEAEADAERLKHAGQEGELTAAKAERTAAIDRAEREVARIESLQAEVARLQATLTKRDEDIQSLQLEQMRLVAQLDTMQIIAPRATGRPLQSTCTGAAGGRDSAPGLPSWRPPLHPPNLMKVARHAKPYVKGRGATAVAPLTAAAINTVGILGEPPMADAATARSDASTLSGGEWPDELHMGTVG